MYYQQIQPPDFLKHYVRYFWVSESEAATDAPYAFTTVPDGGPGLVFQHPDKGIYRQRGATMSSFFLYGLSTRHAIVELTGGFSTIGAHFYPHAAKSVFGIDASELTDVSIDMEETARRQGFFISEQLSAPVPVNRKIAILSAYLFFLVRRNSRLLDPPMKFSVQQILQAKGGISMKDLQDELGLSERSIERKFKQCVGMAPKLFTRICRFQATLTQLRSNNFLKLSDIAYENDYADQSHLIRTFKEFTGSAPLEFLRQTGSVIEHLGAVAESEPLVGSVQFYRVKNTDGSRQE